MGKLIPETDPKERLRGLNGGGTRPGNTAKIKIKSAVFRLRTGFL